MVNTREKAVQNALADTRNDPGMCQQQTRLWLGGPSAGDRDRDRDADAVDGWASEPVAARHTDRQPPAGTPVAWSGGSSGHGHRALSLGPTGPGGAYMIRSTDAGGRGVVATVPLDYPEKNWGHRYLGWSETITGIPIPYQTHPEQTPKPGKPIPVQVPKARGEVPKSIRLTERAAIRAEAKGQKARAKSLRSALALLRKARTQRGGRR